MRHSSKAILKSGGGATVSATVVATAGGSDNGSSNPNPNPNRRTPDHPPYSEMISVALRSLAGGDNNGSSESSISAAIQSGFPNLPWAHGRLLPYYLRKLVAGGELTSPSPGRYQLPFQSPPIRRRGRPRLHPSNPNPNPRLSRGRRGRSQPPRRRGRPRKIPAEDKLVVSVEKGLPPVRRSRGRSRFRRGVSRDGRRLNLRSSDVGKEGFLGERCDFDAAESGKVPTFLTSELFRDDEGKLMEGGEELIDGSKGLSNEEKEDEHGVLLGDGEETKFNECKVDEVVMIPNDEDEVANAAAAGCCKKRKLQGTRRSLRLWFES